MDRTIDTVDEYRLRYPDSGRILTLTRSGLPSLWLVVQDREASRKRPNATRQRARSAPGNAWYGRRRELSATELRRQLAPIPPASRRP